ncbi:MAG: DUF3943 domain-containing protein [Colwellia sp.]|nr:DUF3943 domain-containing protein [Colwellia sp.]
MKREVNKLAKNTWRRRFLLASLLIPSSCLFAQETINNTSVFTPAITEADIAKYYPDKYPVRRWENLSPTDNFYQYPYKVSLFSAENGEDSARLWSQTKSIFVYGFGVIGVIALLPEEISNWDKEDGIFNKWSTNVTDGPVWDRDKVPLNLIGHPYFGGVYYQVARKSGFRQWDSFIYSAMMSTFYWEYGIEAFAETPSIQDLVITPVLGWAYGEWAFSTEMDIRHNNNTLWGSSMLGATALILLDPVDSLSVGVNNLFGKELIKAGTGYVAVRDVIVGPNGDTENQIQFNISLQLGDGGNYNPKKYKKIKRNSDPVNTSIIGLSYGLGQVNLDDYWQVSDDTVVEYSLGLYFSKTFSSRLSYSKAKLGNSFSEGDIAYENYSLDSQYYFNNQSRLRPYFTVGFGEMLWQKDNDLKTFQVNAGTGVHYKLTKKLAVQLDWRYYYSTQKSTAENNMAARLVYLLGDGES